MSKHLQGLNLQLFAEDESLPKFPQMDPMETDYSDASNVSEEQELSPDPEGESEEPDDIPISQDPADLDAPYDEFGTEQKGVPDETYKRMREKAEREAAEKFAKEREEINRERQLLNDQQTERKIREQHLSADNIYRKAEEEGLSEEQAKKMLELEVGQLVSNARVEAKNKYADLQQKKNKLAKDKYFKVLAPEVDELIANNPDLDYEFTYAWLKHEKGEELEKQLSSKVQKRTIADIHDRNRRRSVTSDGGPSSDGTDPMAYMDADAIAMARSFGHDPREIGKYVKKNLRRKG